MRTDSRPTGRLGPLFVLLSALMFSLSGLFIKGVPWSASAVNGGGNLVGALMTAGFMLSKRHRPRLSGPILLGALSMAATSTLFVFANKMTTAANAIVLQFTSPVFIILFMWLIFRQKPQKLDVCACVLVFCGIVCVFVDSLRGGGALGDVLALLSGVTYAGVFLMNTAQDSDPLSSILCGQLLCALLGTPMIALEPSVTGTQLLSILILGVVTSGLAYIFFSLGIDRTPPVTAALMAGIEPILSPIWVALYHKEYISPLAIVGAAVVLVSLVGYNVIKAVQGEEG